MEDSAQKKKIEEIHCIKCKKIIEKDEGRYNTANGSICIQCYNQNPGISLGQTTLEKTREQAQG